MFTKLIGIYPFNTFATSDPNLIIQNHILDSPGMTDLDFFDHIHFSIPQNQQIDTMTLLQDGEDTILTDGSCEL